jgi:hypothetical protein
MPVKTVIPAFIISCGMGVIQLRCQEAGYQAGSLDSDRPQSVYASDPQDSWNRIFHCLFTRTVRLRLTEDFPEGAPFQDAHFASFPAFPALRVSDRTFERIESGDRGIDPLYPSFLDSLGTVRLFSEPRSTEFENSLRAALDERKKRPAMERALMQIDLWAAYDMIYRNLRWVDATRSTLIMNMLARMIRKLALSPEEIAALPDNYAAGANRLRLPDLFGGHSQWIEIEWGAGRFHDSSANDRRSTRIFLNPGPKLTDQRGFVESFRDDRSPHLPLEAVALVTQGLLIDDSGNPVPSRVATEVQTRQFAYSSDGRFSRTEIAEFELSRRAMLIAPTSGGFVRFAETAPAYLAASGNDNGFASGIDSTDGRSRDISIMGSLRRRCAGCHGPEINALHTFSKQNPREGVIKILNKQGDEHAQYVVEQKRKLESWKSLQQRWQQN